MLRVDLSDQIVDTTFGEGTAMKGKEGTERRSRIEETEKKKERDKNLDDVRCHMCSAAYE